MAFNHGSKAAFSITDATPALRDITAYVVSGGLDRTNDAADVTTLGKTSHAFIGGLNGGTIPIEGKFDATVDGYLAGILGLSKAFEYYPNGSPASSTKPKYTGNAILVSYVISTPVEDAASITGSFQIDGDVTRALS